ncbi:MAG: hypothetical protein IJZ85_03870 [Lachnospiraceae bacterium]|nr:hypothetical protein [Lachnospiraceae bacterium]
MKKRVGWTVQMLLIGLSAILVGTGAMIWARPTAETNNSFATGVVRIDLQQTQLDEHGRETQIKEDMLLLPGTDVSRAAIIHNRGNDCYIRVRVGFRGTDQLDESCLYGIDDEWVRAEDGYYYYQRVLPANSSVNFCEGLRIPEDFGETEAGSEIAWEIQADSIQSRNITPDIGAADPWGEVEIQESVITDGGQIHILSRSDKKFVVHYQGEVDKLIVNEENFFGNLPELMPGDEFTDGAKLINNGNRPIRLYFRSVVEDTSDVTDKIQLMIETEVEGNSQVIYEGPLRGDELSDELVLMTIPAESVGKMVFSIYVPPELDNAYALKNKAVQWIFSTERILLPEDGVDTGDSRMIGGYFLLSGLSLGFAVRMIQRKRRANDSRD